VYGFSFVVLVAITTLDTALFEGRRSFALSAAMIPIVALLGAVTSDRPTSKAAPLRVVGIQLEGPTVPQILDELDRAREDHPATDLFVLSEYTFDDVPPPEILSWCRERSCYLIAGGKEPASGTANFRNTAFVVSPEGQIVFRQGKSIPVQFMNDGLPAESQALWDSPWGKIGIGICYDLSYTRVVDRLIELGAEVLIIPTMDAEDWGAHEHWLHAKIAPIRAREYGVPIFRLASSGISQSVNADGQVIASAPFPGQGERLVTQMSMSGHGHLPLDRYLSLPAVAVSGSFLLLLGTKRFHRRRTRTEHGSTPAELPCSFGNR
jgi:apolipoprotein N-acyltransferase